MRDLNHYIKSGLHRTVFWLITRMYGEKHRWNLLSKYHIGNVKALLYDADTDEVKRIISQTENQEKCIGMIEVAEQIEQQDTDLGAMIQNRTGNTGRGRFDGL